MTAADIRDDDPPVSGEVAALLETIRRYEANNARLAARVAELELNPVVSTAFVDELRPLKSLLTTDSE